MRNTILITLMLTASFVQNAFSQNPATQAVQIVVNHYLDLKSALASDNEDKAKAAAIALSDAIKKVPMQNLTAGQHKSWMQNYEALNKSATTIGSTADISAQRKNFEELSSDFYKMLKGMKINSVDLYYQYCPMADAYWISDNKKIENPYYGKKMLTCGSVKETMSAKN